MAYTQTDADNIQTAIINLATGKRRVRVTIGDRTTEYGQAQLTELKVLLGEIKAELASARSFINKVKFNRPI